MLLSITLKPETTTDFRQAVVSGLVFGLFFFFSNHTVLQLKLNSTWDFAFFTLVDQNQRSSTIT